MAGNLHRQLVERTPSANNWRIPFELLKDFHQTRVYEEKEGIGSCLVRFEISSLPRIYHKRADEIERPKTWNAATFADYVQRLTLCSVNRLMQRQIYKERIPHVQAVAQILQRLFEDVGMHNLITPKASAMALVFLCKNTMIPQARAIFDQIDNLRIALDPEVVNVLLRTTSVRKEIHNFTYILRAMLLRGFMPNGETWVTLLQTVDSKEVREVIFREMKKNDLLKDRHILKHAVDEVIIDQVSSPRVSGLDAASLVDFMDSQHGSGWIGHKGACKLLWEFGRTHTIREVIDLFEILVKRGLEPDRVVFTSLITVCAIQRERQAAVDIISRFHKEYSLYLNNTGYRNLFIMAWRMRMFNFARVLWRSACVEAMATFDMTQLIRRSLRKVRFGHSKEGKRSCGFFKATAAHVILGVDPNSQYDQKVAMLAARAESAAVKTEVEANVGAEVEGYMGAELGADIGAELGADMEAELKDDLAAEQEADIAADIAVELKEDLAAEQEVDVAADNPILSTNRKKLIGNIISEDFKAAGQFRLVRNVTDLLRDALKLDLEWWHAHTFQKIQDPAWYRANAIPVEVKPGPSLLLKKKWLPRKKNRRWQQTKATYHHPVCHVDIGH